MNIIQPWQLLLVTIAGWINRRQQDVVAYIQEENRILSGKLKGKRIRFTDDERRRLAVKGKVLGRKVLREVASIVTPDTCPYQEFDPGPLQPFGDFRAGQTQAGRRPLICVNDALLCQIRIIRRTCAHPCPPDRRSNHSDSSSSSAAVPMMQPANLRSGEDSAALRRFDLTFKPKFRGWATRKSFWRLQLRFRSVSGDWLQPQ